MTDQYGLTSQQLSEIQHILSQFPAVQAGILFGSRAKGSMHSRSDIDLALKGHQLDRHTLAQIAMAFDDSTLPYLVDLKALDDIQHPALREHINRVGRCIYQSLTPCANSVE
ncbi:MAG: nucleotidyltransferase domain-containing protein [Alkalimonas sp.]|nr:nucleotidyltransferase domain-containing protein [Alkalimonas sp.]